MSAFANCILKMMKTNEWYDEKKKKEHKGRSRHNVECFFFVGVLHWYDTQTSNIPQWAIPLTPIQYCRLKSGFTPAK